MTPNRIKEIFEGRGVAAARQVAAACRDNDLQALVERLEVESRLQAAGLKKPEIERRAAALAAAREEEAAKEAANEAAFAASLRDLQSLFSKAA